MGGGPYSWQYSASRPRTMNPSKMTGRRRRVRPAESGIYLKPRRPPAMRSAGASRSSCRARTTAHRGLHTGPWHAGSPEVGPEPGANPAAMESRQQSAAKALERARPQRRQEDHMGHRTPKGD